VAKLETLREPNLSVYGRRNWAAPDRLYYFLDSARNLNVLSVNTIDSAFTVSAYGMTDYERLSFRSISFEECPLWGGFYAAPDGNYYVLVGRDNPDQNDALNVVEIRKYDENWQRTGVGYLKGNARQMVKGIHTPFDTGKASMQMVGSTLIVHMASRMYLHSDGLRHQSNMTFEVDTQTMTVQTFDEKYGAGASPYASHSFNQFVGFSGNALCTIDHGDAYPRGIQLGVVRNYGSGNGKFQAYNIFPFEGETGNNFTGVTVTGFATEDGKALVAGSALPHHEAVQGVTGYTNTWKRNIYWLTADIDSGATTFKWLTQFDPNGAAAAMEPRLIQVGAGRYVLLFSVYNGAAYQMNYRLVDTAGTVLASKSWDSAFFNPVSDPILIGSKLYWVGYESQDRFVDYLAADTYLFVLDLADPAAPRMLGQTSIAAASIGAVANKTYTGKALKPAPSVRLDGSLLRLGVDYDLSYEKNRKIGKATMIIKGKGNYVGEKRIRFQIVPKAPSLKTLMTGAKHLAIVWKKVSAAQKITKYQLRYKAVGAKKWTVKTVSAKKTSRVVKKLKKGTKYQVQLRSCKKIGKTNYYSKWSAVRKSKAVK
jgi:hypothetical protein